MALLTKYTLILLTLIALGGIIFLTTGEFPPPSQSVEQIIDNTRFPK